MLILGIDPGTQVLGYSLLDTDGSKPRLVVMDVLYLRKIADFHLRIRKIFDTTQRIIDSYHPDHLAIEAPFAGKNVQSMLKLGKAQGVAIGAAIGRDLSYTEYEPAAVKQRVTGNGNAAKEQVAAMLQSIFGFDNIPQYLDASDTPFNRKSLYSAEKPDYGYAVYFTGTFDGANNWRRAVRGEFTNGGWFYTFDTDNIEKIEYKALIGPYDLGEAVEYSYPGLSRR